MGRSSSSEGGKTDPAIVNNGCPPSAAQTHAAPGLVFYGVDNGSLATAQGPIQGELLVFRLKTADLQNRPLDLHIGQGRQQAVVELDL